MKQITALRTLILPAGLVLAGCQTEILPGDYASTSAQAPETTEFRATSLLW